MQENECKAAMNVYINKTAQETDVISLRMFVFAEFEVSACR